MKFREEVSNLRTVGYSDAEIITYLLSTNPTINYEIKEDQS